MAKTQITTDKDGMQRLPETTRKNPPQPQKKVSAQDIKTDTERLIDLIEGSDEDREQSDPIKQITDSLTQIAERLERLETEQTMIRETTDRIENMLRAVTSRRRCNA